MAQLACHEKHMLHEPCYRTFIDYNNSHNRPAMNRCPLCMKPIVESLVKKKILKVKPTTYDPSSMRAEDAFLLDGDDKNPDADADCPSENFQSFV